MRMMTEAEQQEHREVTLTIQSALSALRLTRCEDEDVSVAKARLESWLSEHEGSWVV